MECIRPSTSFSEKKGRLEQDILLRVRIYTGMLLDRCHELIESLRLPEASFAEDFGLRADFSFVELGALKERYERAESFRPIGFIHSMDDHREYGVLLSNRSPPPVVVIVVPEPTPVTH